MVPYSPDKGPFGVEIFLSVSGEMERGGREGGRERGKGVSAPPNKNPMTCKFNIKGKSSAKRMKKQL